MRNIIEKIKKTAPSYGSLPFWSWNDKLEPEELRKQIRDMKKLGMNGFFMHARGGLETEYLSDEWFDCINACVSEAKKLGMEAWSYDENGWPSGFAGGALLHDPANFAVAIEQRTGAYPEDLTDVIAIYTKNADGSFNLVSVGNTRADVSGGEYLILYKRYDNSYVDTLDGNITDKFIAATHEEYKRRVSADDFRADGAMPGFFTDEPQYYRWGNPYSNILPGEFEKAYVYSIFERLPAIFHDFDGADKFRYDYYLLIHKLFTDNFIKKIYDWCEKNGVMVTGHAVEESSLGGQMMCCGGVMPFYEYEHIPGIDYLGRGIADDIAPKQLGSVCAQLGKKKALSEMFACCGWDVSPTELKRIAELQYSGGVNLMCQHLYPYSERGQRKRDYPLHYSEHNPWHSDMAEFDSYFNNLGAILSEGKEYAPVLVIHPVHGAYTKYKKNTDSLAEIEGKFFELSRLLGENQVSYHYGDEWMMSRMGSVEGASLRVGQCEYGAVIVPFTYSLDRSTAELLKRFIDCGGKVWLFSEVPPYVNGEPSDLSWLKSNISFEDILALRDAVVTLGGKNVPQLRKMTRLTEGGRVVYLTNIRTDAISPVNVTLSKGLWLELDPATLELKPVCRRDEGEKTVVSLKFNDADTHILVDCTGISNTVGGELTASAPEPYFTRTLIPVPKTFRIAKRPENIITLDTARRSPDGRNYDEPLFVMGIKDNLLRERYDGTLYLKFEFDIENIPSKLKAVIEPMYESVTVNGKEVVPDKKNGWFDRSFAGADIAPYVKTGRNEIVVKINHHQRDYVYYVLYGGVSESLRNCLVFDVEIENIYLVGDFAVKCSGDFADGPRNSTVFEGSFALTSMPETVPSTDIVRGGFPFYCGELATEFTYDYTDGKTSTLYLDGRFATAKIFVNGAFAGKMMFNRELELRDFLRPGKNIIGVTLCNSMRNAMGPHHRRDPEPYGVGPTTFSFENEWNGRECPGYEGRYAFVKYGAVK